MKIFLYKTSYLFLRFDETAILFIVKVKGTDIFDVQNIQIFKYVQILERS